MYSCAQCSEIPASSTFTGSLRYVTNIHRSLPNMSSSHHSSEPPKIYPYHLLLITNYRLPSDVDRCNLEVSVFQKNRERHFYELLFFVKIGRFERERLFFFLYPYYFLIASVVVRFCSVTCRPPSSKRFSKCLKPSSFSCPNGAATN